MKQVAHICVVDDSESKREDLLDAARKLFPSVAGSETYSFDCVSDILCFTCHEHVDEIRAHPEEWLMIVDMQMPASRGLRIETHGGYDVMNEFQRLELQCPVVIASSEPINEEHAQQVYEKFVGFVRYRVWCSSEAALREVLAKAGYLSAEEGLTSAKVG